MRVTQFGTQCSYGPGGLIQIWPGCRAQVTASGQLLESNGWLSFGPGNTRKYQLAEIGLVIRPSWSADAIGPFVSIALEAGAGNAIVIKNPTAGTVQPGEIIIPATYCICWVGFPGKILNRLRITLLSRIPVPVGT